jgi:hypothetical protein
VTQKSAGSVEPDVDAGVADGLVFSSGDDDLEFRRRRFGRLLFVFIRGAGLILVGSG